MLTIGDRIAALQWLSSLSNRDRAAVLLKIGTGHTDKVAEYWVKHIKEKQ